MTGTAVIEKGTETELDEKYEFVEYIDLAHNISELISSSRDED